MLYAFSLDAQPWVLVVTGFLERSFLQIASNSIIAVYIPEHFPTDIRGTGLGAATAVGRVAAGTMPYLVLAVLQTFGQVSVFTMLASILLALCLIVLVFGPETRRQTLAQVSPQSNNSSVESAAAKSELLNDHQTHLGI